MPSAVYFDQQDYELLRMVTHILEQRPGSKGEQMLFSAELHPHGIKELGAPRELRIAHAVINLLHSLEAGKEEDRLQALAALYDEVVSVTDSSFRYNTGRALIQIMKELVRAHGFPERQLTLAHDFRRAAGGNRRFVRKILREYHLLEMPEEWNQLTFDHHVHDSHTKGRKTPTHLIMDAWIKGIRSITVIYYNFIEPNAVQELFRAAAIVGITTKIGIEYRAVCHGKYALFIWEPPSIDDVQALNSFLQEPAVAELMHDGRASSVYYAASVLKMLDLYNSVIRHEMSRQLELDAPEIPRQEFLDFVASGQASLLHLAELIYTHLSRSAAVRLQELEEELATAPDDRRAELGGRVNTLRQLHPKTIREQWLIGKRTDFVPNPTVPGSDRNAPPFMRTTAEELLRRLYSIRHRSRITLSIANLDIDEVLELLYLGKGRITHLELYNLKDETAGKMPHCAAVSELQFAINQGSAIVLKRLISDIIRQFRASGAPDREQRCALLTGILYNIQSLQSFYRKKSLSTRIGSDSTSRLFQMHGMGFAVVETLPRAAVKAARTSLEKQRKNIPLQADLESVYTYSPQAHGRGKPEPSWIGWMRHIPGFRYLGYARRHSWLLREASIRYAADAKAIVTLGGVRNEPPVTSGEAQETAAQTSPGLGYMNTRLLNVLKVAAGFLLTMATFSFTQEWWVLAWFGAPIWFGITGFRNIVQAVLAGRGFNRTSLLQWSDYVSWARISDSLLFTGISVPLLELFLRWGVLGQVFSLTSTSDPLLFYTIVSTANGLYIAAHNMFRGLQKEAIIGNLFRSVLAVPLALLYNFLMVEILVMLSLESALPVLADASAIISKAASDTVACIIEGIADQRTNMRMRRWDYIRKLKQLFACCAGLELLLPEEDVLDLLKKPQNFLEERSPEARTLEKSILIHSLDLMYFLLYQPRARTMLLSLLQQMTAEEKAIFTRAQFILCREKDVSQMLVNGDIVKNFSKPLAFYLSRYSGYLESLSKMTGVSVAP